MDRIEFSAGPVIESSAGVPSLNLTPGSLALRRGGPGATLYTKEGTSASNWVPLANLRTKAGTPSDADFFSAPPDGTMVTDTTASKLWVRIGGSWKATVALT